MWETFLPGFELMLIGMVVVFLFLILLVICIRINHWLLDKIIKPVSVDILKNPQEQSENSVEIQLAITTAVRHYRSKYSKG